MTDLNNTFIPNAISIYRGQWTDWSQGRIYGATITVSDRTGNLLQSFAAAFTAFACTQFWTICSFLVHQIRSNHLAKDGLTHQRQAILRNASSVVAAWLFLQQAWKWRGKVDNAALRSSGWIVSALFFAAIAGVTSTLTAFVTDKATSNRLIISPNCGNWQPYNVSEPGFGLDKFNITWSAASYARACYTPYPDPVQCRQYTRTKLRYTVRTNASCPFAEGLCGPSSQTIVNMTTDPLDSLTDLGINNPPTDRLYFQESRTCSPIPVNKYWVFPQDNGTDRSWSVMYGRIGNKTTTVSNYTVKWDTHAAASKIGYMVSAFTHVADGEDQSIWEPIPAFQRTDADVTLVFISSNAVDFLFPSHDPVFGRDVAENNHLPFTMGTIACTTQYRACNPKNARCSPWAGRHQLRAAPKHPQFWPEHGMSPRQEAILWRVTSSLRDIDMSNDVMMRGVSILKVQETLLELFQFAEIPDNQWMTEAEDWFKGSLASLQGKINSWATGPPSLQLPSHRQKIGKDLQSMCNSQLTKRVDNTQNFSVLGLGITFGVGGLVILVALCCESLGELYYTYRPEKSHKKQAWDKDGFLQTHRHHFMAQNISQWTDDDIPTTTEPTKVPHFSAVPDPGRKLETDRNDPAIGRGNKSTGCKSRKHSSTDPLLFVWNNKQVKRKPVPPSQNTLTDGFSNTIDGEHV